MRLRLAPVIAAWFCATSVLAFPLMSSPQSGSETITIRSGESADIRAVYWISDCTSHLRRLVGVEALQSLPGLTLTIREEQVYASKQHCPTKVPGGTVVAHAANITLREAGTIEFRVTYDTEDGYRQSLHHQPLIIEPATAPSPSASPSGSPSPLPTR